MRQLPFAEISFTNRIQLCRMKPAEEAEVGSAGEQPAKEYSEADRSSLEAPKEGGERK